VVEVVRMYVFLEECVARFYILMFKTVTLKT
jgi:hypothetical protein